MNMQYLGQKLQGKLKLGGEEKPQGTPLCMKARYYLYMIYPSHCDHCFDCSICRLHEWLLYDENTQWHALLVKQISSSTCFPLF